VEAVLFKANKPHLDRFIIRLNELGYESSYAVLNAKDFGIPQNRNRCFMVSTLHMGRFVFPTGIPLERCLGDMLEDDVDDSYFLSDEKIASYRRHKDAQSAKGYGFGCNLVDPERESSPHDHYETGQGGESSGSPSDGRGEIGLRIAGLLTDTSYEKAQRVYSTDGLCPCLEAARGGKGGHTPKIEVIRHG